MLAVQSLLDGEAAPVPVTESSSPTSVAVATDVQVVVRSLAEQLVSEANAILREHGDVIVLADEPGPGSLAFTMTYGDRSARVETEVSGHTALAQLVMAGQSTDQPRRLTSEDEVQSLVLSLLSPPLTTQP